MESHLPQRPPETWSFTRCLYAILNAINPVVNQTALSETLFIRFAIKRISLD